MLIQNESTPSSILKTAILLAPFVYSFIRYKRKYHLLFLFLNIELQISCTYD